MTKPARTVLLLYGATVAIVAVGGCGAQPPPTKLASATQDATSAPSAADPIGPEGSAKREAPGADKRAESAATSAPDSPSGGSVNGAGAPGAGPAGRDTNSASVARKSIAHLGSVVVDGNNSLLYRFDRDSANPSRSRCTGSCEKTWPPAIVSAAVSSSQVHGIDVKLLGTVRRSDGRLQLTLNGWPMYRYVGDKKAGQWTGQGKDGAWWAVQPDGRRNTGGKSMSPPTKGNSNSHGTGGNNGGAAPHHW